MPPLRRLTALFASLILLPLTLLGADWSCGTHERSADRAQADVIVTTHDAPHSPVSSDACDTERTPGDCDTMRSCGTSLAIPATLVTLVALATTSDALPEPVSIHSRPVLGPDTPPPRG